MPARCFVSSSESGPCISETGNYHHTIESYSLEATEDSFYSTEEKSYVCFFCEVRFSDKDCLRHHQDICSLRFETLFNIMKLPCHHEPQESAQDDRHNQRQFLEYFNIVSKRRSEVHLGKTDCREQVVCDVILLDDSDEDDTTTELPAVLTSPKRLIPSDSKSIRRGSTAHQSVKRGSNVVDTSHSVEKLLRIDVCSPLGQRVRKHVNELSANDSKRLLGNHSKSANIHCPLFIRDLPFNNRLRQPREYRVSFRFTRQFCRSSHCHVYRFTGRQRREFCRAFDRGLSVRATRLLRRMKPCRVTVKKLNSNALETHACPPDESWHAFRQNDLVLRIRRSVVSLTKCDEQLTGREHSAGLGAVGSSGVDNSQIPDLCQAGRLSLESNAKQPSVVLQTLESVQFCRDNKVLSTTPSVLTTTNSGSVESDKRLTGTHADPVVKAPNRLDSEQLNLVSINNTSVPYKNPGVSSGCGNSSAASRSNRFDVVTPTTAPCSEVSPIRIIPTASSLESRSPTADSGDCIPVSIASDTERDISIEKTTWSMTGDLPAISFFCHICSEVVECEQDSKSRIYEHYAGHGITNIDLLTETTPSGEQVIKLIELPVSKVKSSTTSLNQAPYVWMHSSPNVPVESPQYSSQSEGLVFNTSNFAPSVHASGKRRTVTWVDVASSTTCQQPVSSSPWVQTTYHDATKVIPQQRMTLQPYQPGHSQLPTSSVASSSATSLSSSTESCVVSTDLHSSFVVRSPLVSAPTVSESVSRCDYSDSDRNSNAVSSASKRGGLFWSTSSQISSDTVRTRLPVVNRQSPMSFLTSSGFHCKSSADSVLPTRCGGSCDGGKDTVYESCQSRRSTGCEVTRHSGSFDRTVLTISNSNVSSLAPRKVKNPYTKYRRTLQPDVSVICID